MNADTDDLRALFIQIVQNELKREASDDADTKQALRNQVEEGLMRMADYRCSGLLFFYSDYQQEMERQVTIEWSNFQGLGHALMRHRKFVYSLAVFPDLPRLRRRFRKYHLKEWLDIEAEVTPWEVEAVNHYLCWFENKLIERKVTFTVDDAKNLRDLASLFYVPLGVHLVGFMNLLGLKETWNSLEMN